MCKTIEPYRKSLSNFTQQQTAYKKKDEKNREKNITSGKIQRMMTGL